MQEEKYNSIELQRDELAQNLGGGLPKGTLGVFTGEDGSGKSVMAQRLAYGFLSNKVSVSYVSTELNTISFAEQMDSMDYDVKSFIINHRLLFIPMFPAMGNTSLKTNFLDDLMKTKQIFDKEIIMFDTLSFILLRDEYGEKECYNLINTLKRLTTMGKTILFFIDPTHINPTFLTLIKSVADLYVNLNINTFAGNIIRVIEIVRFKRPQGEFQPRIPFRVEPKMGLAIEIASLA